MTKPLFSWGEQYSLDEEKYLSKYRARRKSKAKELKKQYIRKLRRLLKLKKGNEDD